MESSSSLSSSSSRGRSTYARKSTFSRSKFVLKRITQAVRGKQCPICLEDIADCRRSAVITNCMHAYCIDCIRRWSNLKRKCPLCNIEFDSWFFRINLSSRFFHRQQLPALQEAKRFVPETVYSSSSWLRALSSARRRTRAELPTRRSFGHPRADPPDVITQRVLQWRTSIYEQRLEAIPSTSRVTLEQGVTGNSGFRERILQRIEPWIRRELQAVLRDPDPSVIVHVVTSLFMSILEKKQKASSEQGDIEDRYLEPLRPFLHESTEIFWHELRCFAESSYNLETYDTTVQYKKRRVS